ncbi:MAG TPA: class I SAM-dependent methyltransferase [Candidatus Dormibacteraeota bacterium]|nr:class I SAM-dependent methyltransferase [Candidatus Dormibacteraeota bacterium]
MDEELYRKTLSQYNDPTFARQYATNIADLNDEQSLNEFLALVPAGASILDVACAAGRDSKLLSDKGYDVTGIDQSGALIKIAEKEVPAGKFIQDDFTASPFNDDTFDAIWCNAALVHLPSQAVVAKALSEFRRVLKPGGLIMINTKARLQEQPSTAVKKDVLSDKDRYFRYQSEQEFVALCEKTGFEIIKHRVTNEKDDPTRPVSRDENWLFVIAKKPV